MNTYLTELTAVGPDGVLRVYAGEEIRAITWGMAELYCKENGLGYLRVIGELIVSFDYNEPIPKTVDFKLN